jgi:LDH2 family malate/lactate/ureidoglycolate dehydrogenase
VAVLAHEGPPRAVGYIARMAELLASEYRLSTEPELKRFVSTVLEKVGIAPEDAAVVADVLVAADLRGIESHGVARLESYYVSRLRGGKMNPKPNVKTVRETATSILVDADNGLGHPVAKRTMEKVLAKAQETGAAFGAVRNSNHYGIAGYYAMMGLERDTIGIASTNTVRYGAPTFGRDMLLGTNPLAFAIPADKEPAFVLDFATTTVPRGKIEVYNRKEKKLNPGWAIDAHGNETLDPQVALKGALLPLGGYGVDNGGHKGYGLGLLVEILCGVLSGGKFGLDLPLPTDGPVPGAISHFFAAFRIDGFRDAAAFKADMDRELRTFKDSQKAPGHDRIYVAGEIEHEKTLYHREHGVPVHVKVWDGLQKLAGELGIPFEIEKRESVRRGS